MKLKITFDQNRFDKMIKEVESAPATIQKEMKNAIGSSVMQVHATSVQPGFVPKKTGDLSRSLTFKIDESVGKVIGAVGSNKDYASIQEFGGMAGRNHASKITGKKYLTRSVEENREAIIGRFRKLQILK